MPIFILPIKNFIDSIQDAAHKLVVDLFAIPMTRPFSRRAAAGLTDFGWRACQIKAAIEKICSGETVQLAPPVL